MTVPSVLVAGCDIVSGIAVIADCKMECVGTGASLLVGVVESVNARGGVRVVVPRVGVTGILGERLLSAVVDCQI